MAEFEEKFIVINRKHFAEKGIPDYLLENLQDTLGKIEAYLPGHKYYVCNQDEPYAQDILAMILKGEEAKGL